LILRLAGKPYDLGLRDRPLGGFLRGSHYEIAKGAALYLGSTTDHGETFAV